MATYSTRLSGLWCSLLLIGFGLLTAPIPGNAQDPLAISVDEFSVDLVMFHDPQLVLGESALIVPKAFKELWLKALSREDTELQRLAVDSFKLAQDRGMKDLEDTHARLADLLEVPNQDSAVRRAAVHTLIHLDARDYADLLAKTSKAHGLTTAMLVEPALARWKSDLMTDEWLSRINDPQNLASLASLILAIDGLGETEEVKAATSLMTIARNLRLPPNERIAAVRALSKMRAPGLVGLAQSLVDTKSQPTLLNRVMALELMKALDSQDAIALLKEFASHDSSAIQSGALQRLHAIDPRHVDDFAESAIKSKDAGVRTVGAETLIAQEHVKSIASLATLLDDVNPTLRSFVAKAMVRLARQPELHQEVITRATAVVNRDDWRGIEQATIVLVLLDHKPTGDRLVELLPNTRPEVMITTAWGLRRLALPQHLPAMLARAQFLEKETRSDDSAKFISGGETQLAQLFLAFGQMRYMEAESILIRYVPKDPLLGEISRAAAVWSLGWLHEGQAPAELTSTLIERISDTSSDVPEFDYVRWMCAISMGRMNSQSALATLRKFADEESGYVGRSCYWALERLTGETPPPPQGSSFTFIDWFLVPIR
jgi:hypothetical protein